MKQFLDENFLLNTPTAVKLFHDYSKNLPIIDYHCHINPKEIAEDRQFSNIHELWLGGDHYKWRLMRSAGVDEKYITGDASPREKFNAWAKTLSKAIGNPLYHWSHLELQRYFDYKGTLNEDTAEEVWNLCNEKLAKPEMSVRNIIKASNVEVICTTDDPIDSLEWHKKIAEDTSFDVKVLPAWRPDKAMNIEKDEFVDYISKLSEVSEIKINNFADLKAALIKRMEFFNSLGCSVSDHGLDYVSYVPCSDDDAEKIFTKKIAGEALSNHEIMAFKTAFMLLMGREYSRLNWVLQLHYGCKRNNNSLMFNKLGADTGFDCINNHAPAAEIADYLDCLNKENKLPKTILYSLNPNDNQIIDTILGCFQDSSAVGKIQHGSAWWFNDNKTGMRDQLISLGNLGFLAGFVGMLTDSRSFISYPRHEYFRRIMCNLFGDLVEAGEFPYDEKILSEIVGGISYNNANAYFSF